MQTPASSGMPKSRFKRDGRADHFGQIAGGDGEFADDPEAKRNRPAEMIAAGLGEVAAGGDAEFDARAPGAESP